MLQRWEMLQRVVHKIGLDTPYLERKRGQRWYPNRAYKYMQPFGKLSDIHGEELDGGQQYVQTRRREDKTSHFYLEVIQRWQGHETVSERVVFLLIPLKLDACEAQ